MKRLLLINAYFFFAIALFAQKAEISTSQIVDLGLSVKWAGWNIGATSPEKYGKLYGWADPTGLKSSDNLNDYPSAHPPTNITGTSYDIASVKWGGNWRIPTKNEINELVNKCKWTLVTYRKVKGFKVTGPNGNSIFMPLTGSDPKTISPGGFGITGNYWTSQLDDKDKDKAYGLFFDSQHGPSSLVTDYRYFGKSVRPVMGERKKEPTQGIPLKNVQIVCKKHTNSIVGSNELINSDKEHKIIFELFKTYLAIKVYDGGECNVYKVPKGTTVYTKHVTIGDGGIVTKLWFITSTGIGLEYCIEDIDNERITIWTPKGDKSVKTVHFVNDAYSSFLELFIFDKTMFELIKAPDLSPDVFFSAVSGQCPRL